MPGENKEQFMDLEKNGTDKEHLENVKDLNEKRQSLEEENDSYAVFFDSAANEYRTFHVDDSFRNELGAIPNTEGSSNFVKEFLTEKEAQEFIDSFKKNPSFALYLDKPRGTYDVRPTYSGSGSKGNNYYKSFPTKEEAEKEGKRIMG